MDFNQFMRQRRPRWERLSQLLDSIDRGGLECLTPREVNELFSLYRLVSSDLNLVQTRTGNPTLVEYLEGLVGRAYANLAVPGRVTFFSSWWAILRHRFPAAIRAERRMFALATATMLAGVLLGFVVTYLQPDTASLFVGPEHLAQSPRDRVAELEAMERAGSTRINSAGEHALFSTFLFTHNIRVTVLGFALGMTFGVGTVMVLFYNGAMLGSLAALYLKDGVFVFFLAWVGPHGSIELPCILFGCTGGFILSRAQYRRDAGTTLGQIRAARPRLVDLIVGTACLLVLAGTIEGGFSQVNEPTIPYPLKIAVAVTLFTALLAYLFVMPVKPEPIGDMADSGTIKPSAGA
jgi:uncharacterized membrane protein SpoIIM required for sporulation